MARPVRIWARSLRCLASSTGVLIVASATDTRSRRMRASTMASWIGSGYGWGSRWPAYGPSASRSTSAMSMTLAMISGSSRIRRSVPAIVMNRPGASWAPTVSLITSSRTWASSNTTTSCSGRITPPLPTCSP